MRLWHITEATRLPLILESGLVPGKSSLFGKVSLEAP